MLREKFQKIVMKMQFNQYNAKSESWKRKCISARRMAQYYEIRANEVVSAGQQLLHIDEPQRPKYGFGDNS